jgi:cell wall assembly regulator SMI1
METIRIDVEPGICGFCCQVQAWRQNKQRAVIEITGSECKLVQKLAESLTEVTLQDVFARHTRNPVFKAAEQAGCHLTCPVPVAVLKAAEAALELALPRDACISFVPHNKKDTT